MIQGWSVFGTALVYLLILFAVASYGDRFSQSLRNDARSNTYALSLAIYCTTWTFFGSVGLAAASGLDFLAIYAGPILLVTLGYPLVKRIVRLSKEERITSVADFLGARYGKSQRVAGFAAIIAVVGMLPYIALQMKAVSRSVLTLISHYSLFHDQRVPTVGEIALLIAITLAVFTILFGTRHADATEHQNGLMLAVAAESVVKLAAFLLVGGFVVHSMFGGFGALYAAALENERVGAMLASGFDGGNFAVLTFLSLSVFLMLPRVFHVAVVEYRAESELRRARWLFPAYLVAINVFVLPIAAAGLIRFNGSVSPDDFVLVLPMEGGSDLVAMAAFLGGLSAGTAMVIVACVALAIMISNDLVLPAMLRRQAAGARAWNVESMEQPILNIRRSAIVVLLVLAYLYLRAADNSRALASIGLVSFAAIAQLAPAFFGGLVFQGANARGAIAGMSAGIAVWTYCLLMPTLMDPGHWLMTTGILPSGVLKPENLFGLGMTPIANGVIFSLSANIAAFVAGSMSRAPTLNETAQAGIYIDRRQPLQIGRRNAAGLSVCELIDTASRYLGRKRAAQAFEAHWAETGRVLDPADAVTPELLRFSEQLLASAIGASSSRLVHTLMLEKFAAGKRPSRELLDEASEALKHNRDVLQTALDRMDQGISVFDPNLRLAFWNRRFRKFLNLPTEFVTVGTPLADIVGQIVKSNRLDDQGVDRDLLVGRIGAPEDPWLLALDASERIAEIRTSRMPDGGIVVTWHDITERILVSEALREANETLEKRVSERTRDLLSANAKLELATRAADRANASKTRFLAAAGHDILQPLNAAKLYSAALGEKIGGGANGKLVGNIGRSLESVEEILGAILAISRLDSGRQETKIADFPVTDLFEQLQVEFEPVAAAKSLSLRFVQSSLWVRSDPALLRRVLQNLVSNAIKYTQKGGVVVGCRRRRGDVSIEVADTGIGMEKSDLERIFSEFLRLDSGKKHAQGLGLGLSIVQRIASVLDHSVAVVSQPGRGTRFAVALPRGQRRPGRNPARVDAAAGAARFDRRLVLCVDNQPAILDGMVRLLSQWGCTVRTAIDGKSALAVLRKARRAPDVILADYHLDRETGIDVVRSIRDRYGAAIPAVLVTADRSPMLRAEAENRRVAVLNKPVKPAALRAVLASLQPAREAAE
jgi:Na+/proline symporter/signal transduction histidine kinase/CheY-like chemotaxis protein